MTGLFSPTAVPNYITSIRLVAAALLFLMTLLSNNCGQTLFYSLFIAAGLSDLLDGFIARRFNWCTEFGAKLDSMSDLAFYISTLFFLERNFHLALTECQIPLMLGLAVQGLHLFVSFRRFEQFPAYHTDCARFCAYLVFFGVLLFVKTQAPQIITFLSGAWILCSIEGLTITLVLKRRATNLRGIREALMIK